MQVGVIGLGSMGMGAAMNLLSKKFEVVGCDVAAGAREAFSAQGGAVVASPSALPDGLAVLVVVVVTAGQAEAALFGRDGALAKLGNGGVVVCCTTMSPEAVRGLASRLEQHGIQLIDGPVSGGAIAARAGTMGMMASGPDEAFAKAQPVLDAIAGKVWRLGEEAGVGSTVKLVNQLLAGVHIAAAAEALALGIRAGADPQTLFEVISASAGSSWMWQNRVPHILAGDDSPLSAVNIFVKDLGIVLDQARALTFPLPMASSAHQLFLAAAAAGYGGRDDAFVIRFWQALTGIELPARQLTTAAD